MVQAMNDFDVEESVLDVDLKETLIPEVKFYYENFSYVPSCQLDCA